MDANAMTNLTLYHTAPSRSMVARWMLEEVGEPYDVSLVDISSGENLQPAFLEINPMGKVPALKHGDAVIAENAAIACYLADVFPGADLNVPIDSPLRGPYLKWLFFAPSCLEPLLMDKVTGREPVARLSAGWGEFDTTMDVVEAAVSGSPFLFGERFTAADLVIGSTLDWGLNMLNAIHDRPVLADYCARLLERPAKQRQLALDGALMAGG